MISVAVIVLAAGRADRFGGPKLVASLDGRPLVAHVLGAIAAARPELARIGEVVVVTGFHATEVEGAILGVVGPAGAIGSGVPVRCVRNTDPGRGLASSLRTGLAALSPGIEAALVALGDQPRLAPSTVAAVIDAWAGGALPIVVPHHADGGGGNPALLDRRAWPMTADLEGDRGMAGVIAAHPELVARVDVPGSNPDVDAPVDLAGLRGAPPS